MKHRRFFWVHWYKNCFNAFSRIKYGCPRWTTYHSLSVLPGSRGRALWCIPDLTTAGSGVSPDGRKHALPQAHPTRFLRPHWGKRRDWHLHCAEMKQTTMWRRSLVSFHPQTKNYFLPLKLPALSRLPRTLSPGTARATRVHGALPDSVVLPAPPRRLSTAPIGAKAKLVD